MTRTDPRGPVMLLEAKHPLAIRVHHWVNAVALPAMILSGLMI